MKLSVCLLLISAAMALSGCGIKTAKSASTAPAKLPVPILAGAVEQRDIPIEISTIGTVEAINTVTIKPQLEGQLETVHIKDGDDVAKDQLLFTIDPRPFQALLNQTYANLAANKAKAEQAISDDRRYAALIKTGAVTSSEAETKRTNAESLSAQVKADHAAIEMTQLRLAYCKVKSPISGRAGQVLIDAGNTVKTNDTELVVINQLQPIDVAFSVPESQLAAVREAHARGAALETIVYPASNPAQISTGSLTFIDNQVDAQTGTIKLRATFENADRRLWPGEFVQVRLVLSTERGVLIVPSTAVQIGQQGSFIYVIKPNMTVENRPVKTDRYGEASHIVRSGLKAGERIVTDGQLRLTPGAKVEIKKTLDVADDGNHGNDGKNEMNGKLTPSPSGAGR